MCLFLGWILVASHSQAATKQIWCCRERQPSQQEPEVMDTKAVPTLSLSMGQGPQAAAGGRWQGVLTWPVDDLALSSAFWECGIPVMVNHDDA